MLAWHLNFGRALKKLREDNNLGVREICKKVKYDPGNWSKIENSKIEPPEDEKKLTEWATALGINLKSQEFRDFIKGAVMTRVQKQWPALKNIFKKMDNDWFYITEESFKLKVVTQNNKKVISFENNTNQFVEVIFTIDGEDVRFGKKYSPKIGGIQYPPTARGVIKTMENQKDLFFKESGVVKAYIFSCFLYNVPGESVNDPSAIEIIKTDNNPEIILETKY